jgi:hypothetical protein
MYCKRMKAQNNFEKQTPRDAMQCHAMTHPLSRDICAVPPQRRRWKCSDEMSDEKGRDQKKREEIRRKGGIKAQNDPANA